MLQLLKSLICRTHYDCIQIQLNEEDVYIAGMEIEGILIAIASFARKTASDLASDQNFNTAWQ
ncbi:hypothetical protein [Nostoc sp. MG11]|uniref:hypothetical protein n=1 Tax=Nostoc sp. MG11 TaxID=2721166 RepID=UPI0018681422|nr:hypothetical protein [Nostoc sp. MG11]